MIKEISPQQLLSRRSAEGLQLLDVREEFEVQICRIEGAVNVPLRKLLSGWELPFDPEKEVVCYCHHGIRSLLSAHHLLSRGFKEVRNLTGGINAWSLQVDPSIPQY